MVNLVGEAKKHLILINDKNERYKNNDPQACAEENINNMSNLELLCLIDFVTTKDADAKRQTLREQLVAIAEDWACCPL